MKERVLVIAGSDSSGGAGMQRDIAVLAGGNVNVACVVTAVTAQSDAALRHIHHVPAAIIRAQITAATEEPVHAIKIGMLGTSETIRAVSESLGALPPTPCVLDPVLASTSGHDLLEASALARLREELCPMATLVTPNVEEAARLLDSSAARDLQERRAQAQELAIRFDTSVLLKGGHGLDSPAIDVLATPGASVQLLVGENIDAELRGTGCALASLIAAGLAKGEAIEDACATAKEHVARLLREQGRNTRIGSANDGP